MKLNGKQVKLPKRIKERWVKALRSGKYQQGEGYLLQEGLNDSGISIDTYCCIGVLGDICGIDRENLLDRSLFSIPDYTSEELSIISIPEIIKGAAVSSNEYYNPIVDKLSSMNDEGKSFSYIASYIERYL